MKHLVLPLLVFITLVIIFELYPIDLWPADRCFIF